MFNILANSINYIEPATEAANTEYTSLIQPRVNSRIAVVRATFTVDSTGHTLVVMRPIGEELVFADGDANSGQKVLDIDEDPGSIASGDYCVVELSDGTYQLNEVDSVSSLEITFIDNFDEDVKDGARVFFLGAPSDDHEKAELGSSSEVTFESVYGYFIGSEIGYPVVFYVANATDASKLEGGTVVYSDI
jgi:hypothetical protein